MAKGKRVSDPDPSGYISTWSEGNCYSIRALKQELSRQCPTQRPVLLTDYLETDIAQTAATLFGLEWHKINLDVQEDSFDMISRLTNNGQRPIIFAATLANTRGHSDDIKAIDRVSRRFPLVLHVDACRVFDYLTTASEGLRRALDLPRLRLHHPQLGISGCLIDGKILAATIIAGGSNAFVFPPPVVALKPKYLGNLSSPTVEYVRGSDSTLAGSRDSLGPLMMCLQELKFGENGLRHIYQGCALKRQKLTESLLEMGIPFSAHRSSLDVTIEVANLHLSEELTELGAKALDHGKFLITLQPNVKHEDISSLLSILGYPRNLQLPKADQSLLDHSLISMYTLPDGVADEIESKVREFKVLARSSCGYPLNQATYSALGPVIGHFLTIKIPDEWTDLHASCILERRKERFGLHSKQAKESFKATFTTGSTMGNRIGLHTALAHHPKAFVYFSSASHYSVRKIAGDCDELTNRWNAGRAPRFSEITADEYGRIIPERLLLQVLSDRAECKAHGETYELILFANMGTTFIGGRDDLVEVRKQLSEIGVKPSYIHIDGALDFGFLVDGIQLGPPSVPFTNSGTPVVQGITLSHHKAFGIMVSGEVICYCPDSLDQLAALTPSVEPRAVFETWLFEQIYLPDDLLSTNAYCLQNASVLRQSLATIGVPTRYNENSIITLLERPPPWIVKEFQLAPESGWVHFITMPHISRATIDRFVRAVQYVDVQCATAFEYVGSSLDASLDRHVTLERVTCRGPIVGRVLNIVTGAMLADPSLQRIGEDPGKAILDELWLRYVCGAMTFAAVDDDGEPLVVFLAEAEQSRVIKPSVVLVNSSLHQNAHMLQDVGMQLYGHVAQLLNITLELGCRSCKAVQYSNVLN